MCLALKRENFVIRILNATNFFDMKVSFTVDLIICTAVIKKPVI